MNTYTKFLSLKFLKSISYVFFVIFSLVIILNVLTEVEFFKSYDVNTYLPHYLAVLNSFDQILEMFPFIFLIATQVFFVNMFSDNQINIFKYSGLKNIQIIKIIGNLTLFGGILIITIFYGISSNLKNIYLDYKNEYSTDKKYLAVVTNNGLWIKDIIGQDKVIINASSIDSFYLNDVNISIFDENFNLKRIITSNKANIRSNNWILFDLKILENNIVREIDSRSFYSNFNYNKINSLFSNLSSLSIFELLELKNNYKQIKYSTTEVDVQLQKLLSFPIYIFLMTVLSAIIMFNTKKFKSTSLKIIIGLFLCVIIYYINNLFQVMGSTDKIPILTSVWMTIFILSLINIILILDINEK